MAQKLKFGNGTWATKKGSTLSYNDEGGNFKPLPFTTTRNSIATRVNKEGLIEVVGNDVPRIDYTDSADGVLLLENSRSNLVTYSEDFSNWNTIQSSLTSDYGISPDGSTNSTRCVFSSSNQSLELTVSASNVIATIYIKGTIGETIQFGTNGAEEIFTLSGDWQRLEKYNSSSVSRVTLNTYAGVTARDVEIWGAQVEEGSFPTSYIKSNSGSAVTRLADSCSQTVPDGVIGQTEGTVLVEFVNKINNESGGYNMLFTIYDSSNQNIYVAKRNPTGIEINAGTGAYTYLPNGIFDVEGKTYKMAIGYKQDDFVVYINGVQIWSESSGTIPFSNANNFSLGSYYDQSLKFNSKINKSSIYNTRLSNSELAALTQV